MARRRPQVKKVDANQSAIVAALEAAGFVVQSLGAIGFGCPDLLVCGGNKKMAIMEVKMPGEKLRDSQVAWISRWPADVYKVETPDEAIIAARHAGLFTYGR